MAEIIPVCKDMQLAYSTNDEYITYSVESNGEILYTGRSYKKPKDNKCYFKLNEITENFIDNEFNPEGATLQRATNSIKKFGVNVGDSSTQYWFYNNWDYTFANVATNQVKVLSKPINNKISKSGKFVVSVINTYDSNYNVSIEIFKNNNWVTAKTETLNANSIYHILLNVSEYGNVSKFRVLGEVYDVVNDCIEYQLVYSNKCGGFDVINLNGRTQIEDKFEALYHSKSVLNTTALHEKSKWLNGVKRVFTGNIFWLNKRQAERIEHLFSSTMVWLYDIKNDRMIPVVIEDSSVDYKNNNKLMAFQIKLSESHTKIVK